MQCAEFEDRLNELLDEREQPSFDAELAAHAAACARCADSLAACQLLLDGIACLPGVQLSSNEEHALTARVLAEMSCAPSSFPAERPLLTEAAVELAACESPAMASRRRAAVAMIGIAIAVAAALLIAVLPMFRRDEVTPAAQPGPSHVAGDAAAPKATVDPLNSFPRSGDGDLEPIAWVGYKMADGIKPVTSSMVEALKEFRKRPIFRGEDNNRSSFRFQSDASEELA